MARSNIIYCGVGSRETPPDVCKNMKIIGQKLAMMGRTLRSGHAESADMSFELGSLAAGGTMEIYLPWNGFRKAWANGRGYRLINERVSDQLNALVHQFHPAPQNLSQGAFKMMMRNCHQILGANLDEPVNYVLFWAPSYKVDPQGKINDCEGGTGFAVRLAYASNIPCYHLGVKEMLLAVAKGINVEKLVSF